MITNTCLDRLNRKFKAFNSKDLDSTKITWEEKYSITSQMFSYFRQKKKRG